MRKPLEFCVNGCGKPTKRPSWVLCADCLAELDRKMRALLAPAPAARADGEGS